MPKNNIGRDIIPFTIINNIEVDSPVYLYMFGNTDPEHDKYNTYYVSDLKGNCEKFIPNAPRKSYGLLLSERETVAFFPQIDAGRIYISFASELFIDVREDGIPKAVSADVEHDNPNYRTTWDFVEATWHDYGSHTVLHVNTTQVDAFGLAFKLEHSGFKPGKPGEPTTIVSGFDAPHARRKIIDELVNAGDPWKILVIAGGARALMPLKSLDLPNKFPKDQLDAYIKDVMQFYQGDNRLTFEYLSVTYTGTTTPGVGFDFTPDKAKDNDGRDTSKYSIRQPTTRDCYAQLHLAKPDDEVGRAIWAALSASFLRSTLIFEHEFPVPQEKRSVFYTKKPINEYAKIIHKYGINNHAFCYGYDEVAQDAGINRDVWYPTSLKLTIQQLGGK